MLPANTAEGESENHTARWGFPCGVKQIVLELGTSRSGDPANPHQEEAGAEDCTWGVFLPFSTPHTPQPSGPAPSHFLKSFPFVTQSINTALFFAGECASCTVKEAEESSGSIYGSANDSLSVLKESPSPQYESNPVLTSASAIIPSALILRPAVV